MVGILTGAVARFETARLVGEPLGPQHFEDLLRLYTDVQVTATLGGFRTAAWIREYLDAVEKTWADGFDLWHLRDRETGMFAGRGGLRRVNVDGTPEVEVGWAFMPDFWGHGLATELGRAAVAIGFDTLGLDSIVSFTLVDNAASRRVMEKCGLVYERSGPWADLPHVFYRITADSWRAGAAG
jgi:ribosomal-protein-alanine N-acetyltransferase